MLKVEMLSTGDEVLHGQPLMKEKIGQPGSVSVNDLPV